MEFPRIELPDFAPSEEPEIKALQTAVAQLGITLGQMQTAVAALQADVTALPAQLAEMTTLKSATDDLDARLKRMGR